MGFFYLNMDFDGFYWGMGSVILAKLLVYLRDFIMLNNSMDLAAEHHQET